MTWGLDRRRLTQSVRRAVHGGFISLFVLGVVLPWVTPPIPTFYKEGLVVAAFALLLLAPTRFQATSRSELSILAVLVGLALVALDRGMFVDAGVLLIAGVVLVYAARCGDEGIQAFAMAVGIAALISAVLAFVQVFLPGATSLWLTHPPTPGRASANLGQPNHLATLLILGLLAWHTLRRVGCLHPALHGLFTGLLAASLALTGSRTGWICLAVVTGAWLLRGGRAGRAEAATIWIAFALALVAQWGASIEGDARFYLADRARGAGDISSSRLALWRETLRLIADHPLFGVGWGNFNWVWTFTPFSDRPPAFYANAHNLPLQLAVELGLPVGLGICAALAFVGMKISRLPPSAWTSFARLGLLTLAIHSGLEYPLWYAYFLLPGVLLLGFCIGRMRGALPSQPEARTGSPFFISAALLISVAAATTASDFEKVKAVFSPSIPEMLSPLPPRILRAQGSRLFGYFGDYAAITTLGSRADGVFERPLHHLINDRLLFAYANGLWQQGRRTDAEYAFQRLREFPTPFVRRQFSACSAKDSERSRSADELDRLSAMCLTTPASSNTFVR